MSQRHESAAVEDSTSTVSALDEHRESLQRRLEDGYHRIHEANLVGADVSEWESFWIRLLREYEDVCRELDIAA